MIDKLTEFVLSEEFKEIFVDAIVKSKKESLKAIINNPSPELTKTQYNEIDMMLKCNNHIEQFVNSVMGKAIIKIVANSELSKADQDKLQQNIAELKKIIINFI